MGCSVSVSFSQRSAVPACRPRDRGGRSIRAVIRNASDALLSAFDGAEGTFSTPRRITTTTAPQALLLFNGEPARAFAEASPAA